MNRPTTSARTLYIAGPMTGLPEYNYPAFFTAQRDLEANGYAVLNPARRPSNPSWTWLRFMRAALHDVAECDGIATLPGWQSSRGASLEVEIARRLGLPVRAWPEWCSALAPASAPTVVSP